MTFTLMFDKAYKFYTHFVFFLLIPDEYKLEMSLDNTIWITGMDWKAPGPVSFFYNFFLNFNF